MLGRRFVAGFYELVIGDTNITWDSVSLRQWNQNGSSLSENDSLNYAYRRYSVPVSGEMSHEASSNKSSGTLL